MSESFSVPRRCRIPLRASLPWPRTSTLKRPSKRRLANTFSPLNAHTAKKIEKSAFFNWVLLALLLLDLSLLLMQVSIISHTLLAAPTSEDSQFKFHSTFCRYTKPHHNPKSRAIAALWLMAPLIWLTGGYRRRASEGKKCKYFGITVDCLNCPEAVWCFDEISSESCVVGRGI